MRAVSMRHAADRRTAQRWQHHRFAGLRSRDAVGCTLAHACDADFTGKVLSEHEQAATLPALTSTKVASYTDAQLLQGADPHTSFAVFELVDGDKVVSRNRVFFDEAKNLQLPAPQIRTQLQVAPQGYALTLTESKQAGA